MNMKRLLTLVAFFATLQASAQQVNPVPDYVFRNQMSVGRNAVTDTAAYFSIGPRYGATKGFMPPIVGDTATFSSGKRNGLLIFSVQKNKFLYWDSVGVKWAEMAGTAGTALTSADTTALLSTRAWRQKGIDSVASVTSANYVKYTNSIADLNLDTFDLKANKGEFVSLYINAPSQDGQGAFNPLVQNISTGLVQSATYDSLRSFLKIAAGSFSLDKGLVNITGNTAIGSNVLRLLSLGVDTIKLGNLPDTSTIGATFQGSYNTGVGLAALGANIYGSDNTAVGANALQSNTVGFYNSAFGHLSLGANLRGWKNTSVGAFSMLYNTNGTNQTAVGFRAMANNTTGSYNTAVGNDALYNNTTGYRNNIFGAYGGQLITTGNNNTLIGYANFTNLTTGSNNTVIGSSVVSPSVSTNNNIILADGLGNIKARHDSINWTFTSQNTILTGGIDVKGTFKINANQAIFDDENFYMTLQRSNIVFGYIGTGSNTAGGSVTDLGIRAENNLIFASGGSTKARLSSDGEFFINTSSDAGDYRLQVSGSIYNTANAILSASSGSVAIGTTSANGKVDILSSNSTALGWGNLNLYTSTAQSADIGGSIAFGGLYNSNQTTHWAGIGGRKENSTSGNFGGYLQFSTRANGDGINTERARITSLGEFLINTTTDAGDYKLQVSGNIYNTGSLTTGAPSGGSIKPWKIGEAATVSPTSPNRTLRVEVDGVVYYIHAKTTND